ncbi:MAG: hypothetical protein PHH28_10365 [Desulfuromonadaceae bacterium]|nr:hypothetical protein [Desulfuromonadaceae bacterium]
MRKFRISEQCSQKSTARQGRGGRQGREGRVVAGGEAKKAEGRQPGRLSGKAQPGRRVVAEGETVLQEGCQGTFLASGPRVSFPPQGMQFTIWQDSAALNSALRPLCDHVDLLVHYPSKAAVAARV